MMKKMTALLMALCLILSLTAGMAEDKLQMGSISMNGAFRLQCKVPEGYEVEIQSKDNEGLLALITAEDPVKPSMFLAIEFDEQYYDVDRLNDMTEEQLKELESTYTMDGEEVNISYRETAYGTRLMVVQDAGEPVGYVSIFTIYKGYDVEFDLVPGYDSTIGLQGLTEEQIQMAVDFLSDLDFIAEE